MGKELDQAAKTLHIKTIAVSAGTSLCFVHELLFESLSRSRSTCLQFYIVDKQDLVHVWGSFHCSLLLSLMFGVVVVVVAAVIILVSVIFVPVAFVVVVNKS